MPGMRILLTNDDGIHAPGIMAAYEALKRMPGVSEVYVVAPLTVQSATGHGITYHEPLMVQPVTLPDGAAAMAVDGRPADCVKLAISELWAERPGASGRGISSKNAGRSPRTRGRQGRPDLVISGINSGANCGINVIYSGTVAAAIEAAFLGVPSIALSLLRGKSAQRFDVAASWAVRLLQKLLGPGAAKGGAIALKAHECLSINFPKAEGDGPRADRALAAMPRVHVCPMNTHGLMDKYEKRTSPTGEVYYWAAGHGLDFHARDPGTDVAYVVDGAITVTPLQYDLTDRRGGKGGGAMERWARAVGGR